MKHPACEGCEFDGKCLTEKLYEADCPEVQNYEKEKVRRFEGKLAATDYNLALDDAKAAVGNVNVCTFIKCVDLESNGKCFLENNPDFFGTCEKIEHFETAIKAIIAAIEGLRRKG
jgi:hypothetical protein